MKMKQKVKRFLSCALVIAMLMTLSTVMETQAAATTSLPETYRFFTKNGISQASVELSLSDANKSIANVQSKSKDLTAKLTGEHVIVQKGLERPVLKMNTYIIGLATQKEGTYTVTYDIMKNGQKVQSKKLTVYAYPAPVKSFLVGGSSDLNYKDAKSATIKVTLLKGNQLKKLEVGTNTWKKNDEGSVESEVKYRKFDNGESVTLGTSGYYREMHGGERTDTSDNASFWGSRSTTLITNTPIRIIYKDQYTKQAEVLMYYPYGWKK